MLGALSLDGVVQPMDAPAAATAESAMKSLRLYIGPKIYSIVDYARFIFVPTVFVQVKESG